MASKFVIGLLVIIILIKDGALTNPLLLNLDDQVTGLCSENAKIIWRFSWQYFKDMHAVVILGNEDASIDFSNEIMKCSMKDAELSVQFNASVWNVTRRQAKRRLEEYEVIYRHKMNGLIFIKETAKDIKTIFPPIDQETKVVIILTSASEYDIQDVLISAWTEYKILDLVVFHIVDKANAKLGTIAGLHSSVYNPFVLVDGLWGFGHTLPMKDYDWTRNKLRKIMNARLMDVHGYPLKISTYGNRYLNVAKCAHRNCEVTHAIIKTMNFNPEYSEGNEANGVEAGLTEMTARMINMKYAKYKYSAYLSPVVFQRNAFLVPKMQRNSIVSFLKIFDLIVSAALAFTYVAMVVSWRCLQKLNQKWRKNDAQGTDFVKICCIIFGNMLLVSQPSGGEQRHERLLFITWICFSMVICYSYQATMVEHLAAGGPSGDLNTMDELSKSNLKILCEEEYEALIKENAADKEAPQYYKHLVERSEIVWYKDFENAARSVANNRDAAMLCNIDLCQAYKFMFQSKTGQDTIHILDEGLPGGYLSLKVTLDSPYKERFNQILMRIIQSGLIPKWDRDVYLKLELESMMKRVFGPETRNDVYRMQDLSFIFWSWLGCCFFCFLVFLGELSRAYRLSCVPINTITST